MYFPFWSRWSICQRNLFPARLSSYNLSVCWKEGLMVYLWVRFTGPGPQFSGQTLSVCFCKDDFGWEYYLNQWPEWWWLPSTRWEVLIQSTDGLNRTRLMLPQVKDYSPFRWTSSRVAALQTLRVPDILISLSLCPCPSFCNLFLYVYMYIHIVIYNLNISSVISCTWLTMAN